MSEQPGDFLIERVGIGKIHQPDRAAPDLVFIGRSDAALRGADLESVRDRLFAVGVKLAMQRQNQDDVFRDLEIGGRDRDALRLELGHLGDEMVRIEHDAVADHRELARPHNAGWQQRELEDLIADDQRMAGVVAALEAHDDIRLERQPIDDLAFSLVAPLGADHHDVRHCSIDLSRRRRTKNPGAACNGRTGAHCRNEIHDGAAGVKRHWPRPLGGLSGTRMSRSRADARDRIPITSRPIP